MTNPEPQELTEFWFQSGMNLEQAKRLRRRLADGKPMYIEGQTTDGRHF